MNNNTYSVYCHINKINNKIYIGITKNSPKYRWHSGHGYCHNTYFYNAIKKYGWNEGFLHIVLFSDLTKEMAEIIECELISKYRSYDRNYGYNIKLGGNVKECFTEETKLKISNSKKGTKLTDYQLSRLNETRRKTPIVQLDMNGNFISKFDSTNIVSKLYNYETKGIRECCNKKRHSAYGYIWMYLKDYEIWDGDLSFYKGYGNKTASKKVKQININTNEVLNIFESSKDAERKTGIKHQNINNCCNNKERNKTAGGYAWQFA